MKRFIWSLLLIAPAFALAATNGAAVMVDWKGKPYKAYILKSQGGRHFVHYDGWPSSYDEWIADSQIIGPKSSAAASQPAKPQALPARQAPARHIWVLWNGKPYKALIHKSQGGRHFVSYPGWPSNYDEWISESQILTEQQAQRLQAEQAAKQASGPPAQGNPYQELDKARETANRLNQETQQQHRDTEKHYERRRQYGY